MTGKSDRNRTIRFTVRVNEKEARWLKEAAWREKRSIADFISEPGYYGRTSQDPCRGIGAYETADI